MRLSKEREKRINVNENWLRNGVGLLRLAVNKFMQITLNKITSPSASSPVHPAKQCEKYVTLSLPQTGENLSSEHAHCELQASVKLLPAIGFSVPLYPTVTPANPVL